MNTGLACRITQELHIHRKGCPLNINKKKKTVFRKIPSLLRKEKRRSVDTREIINTVMDSVKFVQSEQTFVTYCSHVVCTKSKRYPHVILPGHVSGTRQNGRPRKRRPNNIHNASETWKSTSKIQKKMDAFHQRNLQKKTIGVTWKDKMKWTGQW